MIHSDYFMKTPTIKQQTITNIPKIEEEKDESQESVRAIFNRQLTKQSDQASVSKQVETQNTHLNQMKLRINTFKSSNKEHEENNKQLLNHTLPTNVARAGTMAGSESDKGQFHDYMRKRTGQKLETASKKFL